MSALLDIIIIVIIGLSVFLAAKRGFIKTLLGSVSFILAIIISIAFLDPLKGSFINSSMAESAKNSISDAVAGLVSSDSDSYDPALLEDNTAFIKMMSVFGIDEEELSQKWDEWRHQNTESLRTSLEEYIAEPVVDAVATATAFIVLFAGTLILLKLVTFLLDRFAKLPVLKQANTFLGVILGVIMAVLYVYLFVAVINILLPFGRELGWGVFQNVRTEDTLLFGWFADNNLFNLFLG